MPHQGSTGYGADLAYIHNAGFGGFATNAAAELVTLLARYKIDSGLVVDLGCGGGILAEAVVAAGFDVLGIDRSPAMIKLCRGRAPAGEFRCGSFVDTELPACVAVTAIGEVLNYLFDTRNTPRQLPALFRRVYDALQPGGLFLFDVATPGRVPGGRRQGCSEGDDWACLFAAEEDRKRRILTRRITSFRRVGPAYRRESEIHRLHLHLPAELKRELRKIGFRVRTLRGYGKQPFPPGYIGFLARR
jgi:SAM-dependent methyltransferase